MAQNNARNLRGSIPEFTGATGSTISFSNARAADAGDYAVVIKNPLGSTTSNKAKLTVSAATTPTPTPTPSSGGGGSLPAWFALTLLTLAGIRRFQSWPERKF